MADLSPAQRDLLAAVGRDEATWYHPGGRVGWAAYVGNRKVTARLQALVDRRLVERTETARLRGGWRLTPAGRAALESTPETQR